MLGVLRILGVLGVLRVLGVPLVLIWVLTGAGMHRLGIKPEGVRQCGTGQLHPKVCAHRPRGKVGVGVGMKEVKERIV